VKEGARQSPLLVRSKRISMRGLIREVVSEIPAVLNDKNAAQIMKTRQKGFTLIELMVVVTIIGLLAMFAVPAYQDFTIRSKVSEAASLVGPTRVAIDNSYSDGHNVTALPPRVSLSLASSASYQGRYVASVTYATDSGNITVIMQNISELGLASGRQITWMPTPQGGTLSWAMSTDPSFTTVPGKYLPR